jgi:hypothetical protein
VGRIFWGSNATPHFFGQGDAVPLKTPCWGGPPPQTPVYWGDVDDCCKGLRTRRQGGKVSLFSADEPCGIWRTRVREEWGQGPAAPAGCGAKPHGFRLLNVAARPLRGAWQQCGSVLVCERLRGFGERRGGWGGTGGLPRRSEEHPGRDRRPSKRGPWGFRPRRSHKRTERTRQ